jgi:beta-galactosidase
MYYGGDYNPEQWPEEVWSEDVALMRQAGVNLVSVGIFSWSRLQPAEGEFDFGWLDRVLDLLDEAGIAVDLATATASPPPWMHEAYPQVLPVTQTGVTLGPGSRQHYSPSSPDYRRLAGELVTAIAKRYAQHPAVVMWHVNNEYACHVNCDYSDAAAVGFRGWLEKRYGSVEDLNDAWGTSFWSQRYTSFSQVLPTRAAPYSHNPGQLLDFRRFTSDSFLECFLMERDLIRAAGATQPITTNFMGAFAPLDYWEWAKHVDIVSDDCYPDPNDPSSFQAAALQNDLMRSLKPGVPWLLMEQSTSALNWRPSNAPKAPGQMAALSHQAVGRGATGVMFFQWRQGRAGAEKFHSAMLPQAGTRTRIWREVVALGAELAALPDLPAPTRSKVAIVLDWGNWWALQSPDHPVRLDYLDLIRGWHAAAMRLHVQVDFVQPTADLHGYDLVVAPQLYLLSENAASNLVAFVEAGGTLLATAFSDVVDEYDRFRPGGYLRQLGRTLGIWVEDFGALQVDPSLPGESEVSFLLDDEVVVGRLLAEEVHLDGARSVADFRAGRVQGQPALTVNHVGRGSAWYLATIPDGPGNQTVLARLLSEVGILPALPDLPETVSVSERGDLITLTNQSPLRVTVDVEGEEYDGGTQLHLSELAPFQVVRLRAVRRDPQGRGVD